LTSSFGWPILVEVWAGARARAVVLSPSKVEAAIRGVARVMGILFRETLGRIMGHAIAPSS